MRVTAALAYSQLKINRPRTVWSLAAIALSTALLTAVCSLVASGNAMLVGFLGADYGEYGQAYMGLLLVPAVLFAAIILAMSVVVISNVFRISAEERMAQFGILKCVGATGKQISATVLYESVFLSAVGIPAGMALGVCLALGGIELSNLFLTDLNALTHIMMTEVHFALTFVFSWQALLVGAIVSFLSVLFSAWLPARKAARASAVDSVRGAGSVTVKKKRTGASPLIQRLFGFEGTLAAKNIRRNKRNFRATVIALTAGIILFICLGALSQLARQMQSYMQPDVDETVISEYISARTYETNASTGRKQSLYRCPINSEIGSVIAEKLREYDGKSVFGVGVDSETHYTLLPVAEIGAQMQSVLQEKSEKENENTEKEKSAQTAPAAAPDTYELRVELIALDALNYEALCKKAGVPVGSTILLNAYHYNDNGTKIELAPYLPTLKSLTLLKADGSAREVTIDGVLTKNDIPKQLFSYVPTPVQLIVPQAEVRGFSWYSAPENEAEFIAYANSVLEAQFPASENADYMEDGFNTRVFKLDDYVKVMNLAISLVLAFLYSFVALLMLIGVTNVVSTMSTNVLLRAREFAVLQSVGITPEGLQRMLALESILCSLKALGLGLPIGIVLTYLINLPIRATYPIPYEFPWLSVLLCSLGVLLLTGGTTLCAVHRLRNRNIIESIRTQSGR